MLKAFTVFGVASALYAVSRLLLYYASNNEFRGKPDTPFRRAVGIISIILGYFSLPAFVVFGSINSLFSSRRTKIHDHDMNLAEQKYIGKCAHCYSKKISRSRPFGYDAENQVWTDSDSFSIYIPPEDTWPQNFTDDEDYFQLYSDLYTAFMARRPFSLGHIGKTNPYTGKIIENEDDYENYIHELASSYANKYRDPFSI